MIIYSTSCGQFSVRNFLNRYSRTSYTSLFLWQNNLLESLTLLLYLYSVLLLPVTHLLFHLSATRLVFYACRTLSPSLNRLFYLKGLDFFSLTIDFFNNLFTKLQTKSILICCFRFPSHIFHKRNDRNT